MNYHQDHDVTLHQGDAATVLADFPEQSVNCVVTSPPYFGLRDYGVDGQIGLEQSPAEYVAALVEVFRQVRRVLRDDGVVWLNLGDSYAVRWGSARREGRRGFAHEAERGRTGAISHEVPEKNLLGIPWRVAFALQDDGWVLRNAVIWHKTNAMPESVTDRLSTRYEQVFLFSKSRRYWFDLDPIREPLARIADTPRPISGRNLTPRHAAATDNTGWKDHGVAGHKLGRNPGDVWTVPTSPFPGAHFATMPPALARRCILAGCPDGGTILDPFTGSGTTGMVARQTGRHFVGIDLNPAYLDLAVQRIGDPPLDFGASA